MITTGAKSKIVGVTLGKAAMNVLHQGIPPLTAEFALIRDDGEFCGLFEKRLEWSDRTMKAIAELQSAMEQDALEALFDKPAPGTGETEPQQV